MLIDDGVCIKWKRTIIIGQGDLFYKIISGEITTLRGCLGGRCGCFFFKKLPHLLLKSIYFY